VTEASSFLAPLQVYPALKCDFTLRVAEARTSTDKDEALKYLEPHHQKSIHRLGFPSAYLAEQIHGNSVALITPESPALSLGADGLITNHPNLLLGVYVADCGPVYLYDSKKNALGLVHSGKKGTQNNILHQAIQKMKTEFGTSPEDLTIVLGPCIRPPDYEIDFASEIFQQALSAGVLKNRIFDSQISTAQDLTRYYSYRAEKGNTGRHLALLGRHSS